MAGRAARATAGKDAGPASSAAADHAGPTRGSARRLGNQAAQRLGLGSAAFAPVGGRADPAERRASALAARAGGHAQRCHCGGTCPRCRAERLAAAERGRYEAAYGSDLGHVHLHSGPDADAAAESVGASAFAFGGHVVLSSRAGPDALGHELAHVALGDDRTAIRRVPLAPGVQGPEAPAPDQAQAAADQARDIEAEARDPAPGERTAELRELRGLPIATLSDDAAHTRRALARAIGAKGFLKVDNAITWMERRASFRGAPAAEKAVAAVARAEYDRLEQDWTEFSLRVRTVAAMRLEHNIQALAQWADYVRDMPAGRVVADMTASNNLNFVQRVVDRPYVGPHDMMDMAEMWATTTSPGQRRFAEMLAGRQINSGCQECHVRKDIPDYDRSIPEWDVRRQPVFERSRAIALADLEAGGWVNPTIHGREAPGETASPDMRAVAEGRPGLTSVLDSADMTRPVFRSLQSQVTGRPAHEPRVADSPGDLVRMLYISNVIVEGSLDDGKTGAELRTSVLAAIASRRGQMARLKADVLEADYDFLLLEEMVQAMIGGVDADVRVMVRTTRETRAREQRDRSIAEAILSVAALIMLITPLAPLGIAIGAGLAVSQLQQGWTSFQQGTDILAGTGAGVFTQQQEMMAGEMVASGLISMALSSVDLVSTGFHVAGTASRLARTTDAAAEGSQALARTATPGGAGAIMPDAVYSRPVFDQATGTMRVTATRMTEGGAGETIALTLDMRTRQATAVVTTPQGRYTIRFSEGGVTEVVPPPGVVTATPGASTAGSPGTALVLRQPDALVPFGQQGASRVSGAATATTEGLPQGSVLLEGGGVWLRGPIVTPPPRAPIGLLPETSGARIPSGYVIDDLPFHESLGNVQPWQLPPPGERYWDFSAGRWNLYRPASEPARGSRFYDFLGAGGERSTILHVPETHHGAQISTSGANTGVPRAWPAGLNRTDQMEGWARSHAIPLAESTPNIETGLQSTRTFDNFVGHDTRYNEFARMTLEGQLRSRGSSWYAIQQLTGQSTTAGVPISVSETIIELGANGAPIRAWRFNTQQGAWDAIPAGTLGNANVPGSVFGPVGPGSSQIPLGDLPARNVSGQ